MLRARQALAEIQNAGRPVTMTAAAARAGISRAWLYSQAELRQQISALRSTPTQPESPRRVRRLDLLGECPVWDEQRRTTRVS